MNERFSLVIPTTEDGVTSGVTFHKRLSSHHDTVCGFFTRQAAKIFNLKLRVPKRKEIPQLAFMLPCKSCFPKGWQELKLKTQP